LGCLAADVIVLGKDYHIRRFSVCAQGFGVTLALKPGKREHH